MDTKYNVGDKHDLIVEMVLSIERGTYKLLHSKYVFFLVTN